MEADCPPLFERLPADIFRPLAGSNNRRYWVLLCKLIGEIWGDGGRPPGEEVPKRSVISVIESHLAADDPWEDEDGDGPETPLGIRAHGIFNRFRDSGWFTVRQSAYAQTVTIRPLIAQFFAVLSDFATQEPEFLGGKFSAIHLLIRGVAGKEAGGDAYAEAANQAKRCISHIANTGCRVHDVMEKLITLEPRDFVRGFFEHYIENVFIGDYSELRTKNHPLQFRSAIIAATLQIKHDAERREALITWYQDKRTQGDRHRAEALFERDTRLLMRLNDVEDHLQRLDDEIRIANQRALAFFEYKLRAPRGFDKLMARAIAGVHQLPEDHIALPAAAPGDLASEFALAKPRAASREVAPTPLERRQPTLEELAMQRLRKCMVSHRMVTPAKLATYVARHLNGTDSVISDDLSIASINDLCCYQRLLLIATRNSAPAAIRKNDIHVQMLPRVRIAFVEGRVTKNAYMEHRQFTIRRETAR